MYRVYTDETVDRAIAKGLEELKVTEADVKIDVEEEGKKGLFGFGRKDAVVRLTIINPELKMYESIEALIARDAEKTDSIVAEEEPEDDGAPDSVTEPSDSMEENENEEADVIDTEELEHVPAQDDAMDEDVRVQIPIEEAAEQTRAYVEQIIQDMNIERTSEVEVAQNEVRIELFSPMAAKLIGKRGVTLNALQEVAQQFFNSIYKSYGVITLDVEDYREKRRETLENLAVNMAKKAKRTEGPVKLEPMPSFERKIMHHVLSTIEDIETYSEGAEPNRYIVIEKK
ncbi:RNA-binding cell elongation regulator Jag/EloR [Salinicoccus luteus]|uniref:RNA-binding cell elongation regulator Jag/EloR n=1 Tax=Salinicoccus luteus TaxID=367840 RepID=UPI0004E25489|nr:RNA-binding cell elongation regulator Jag/EloR [Salinicoccus luteus]